MPSEGRQGKPRTTKRKRMKNPQKSGPEFVRRRK